MSLLALRAVAWGAEQPTPTADSPTEIIVTTPRGRANGGIDPVLQISPSELDSSGTPKK